MFRTGKRWAVSAVVATGMALGTAIGSEMPEMDDHSGHHMHMGAMSGGEGDAGEMPVEAGQDVFSTIQEIIGILQNDPATDWSRVNIRALREHLLDMNDLALKSDARVREIAGGLEMDVSGEGRVREALGRMIPAHAPMLRAETGWNVVGTKTETGARLVVISDDPAQVARIRGLGFYGLMATGAHHQNHHLGMARGDMVHGK